LLHNDLIRKTRHQQLFAMLAIGHFALALVPGLAAGQTREAARLTLQIADSLGAIQSLQSLTNSFQRYSSEQSDASTLRAALIGLRIVELGGSVDTAGVLNLFERLARRARSAAWSDYGRAMFATNRFETERARTRFDVVVPMFVPRSLEIAISHFNSAIESDSAFEPALVGLARAASATYDVSRANAALAAIDRAASSSPKVIAAAVELELIRDSVAQALRRLASAGDGTNADLLYARAMVSFRSRDPGTGISAYRAALESRSAAVAARALADVGPLLEPTDTSLTANGLGRFWQYRAAMAGVTEAERMAQHFVRLHEARQKYRRVSSQQASVGGMVASRLAPSRDLDDRGVVYVRFGEPDESVRTVTLWGDNESWVYTKGVETPLSFHFIRFGINCRMAGCGSFDYALVSGIIGCLDTDYYSDRASYDLHLARAYVACTGASGDAELKLMQLDSESRMLAAASMTRVPVASYEGDLPFYYSAQTVKSLTSSDPVQLIVLAVPVSNLRPLTVSGGVQFRFRVTASVVHPASNAVRQVDTAVSVVAAPNLQETALLRVVLEVPGISGSNIQHRVRVVDLNQSGVGQVYAGDRDIASFAPRDLAISDLIFARSGESSMGWRRAGLTLDVVPVQEFRFGTFGLFFELYNVTAGGDYRIDVMIGEQSGGMFRERRSLRVSFTETMPESSSPGGTIMRVPVLKSVSTDGLPGKYIVRVQVTEVKTGMRVANERELTVTRN